MNKITTDDIFGDLGFPPEEAAELNRKSMLMIELELLMKRRKLNAPRAAKAFGVERSVMDHLKGADMDFFTVDLLIRMLERGGKKSC